MATITLRSVKGSPLTNTEVDTNFSNLNTELGQKANAADAALTGNPTAPTPTLDDNDTSIATSAFARGLKHGVLSKSVAGGVTVALTAAEASYGVLKFTGALTASINVTVPDGTTANWIVTNATTGAYTLTVKTVTGTGIAVVQGKTTQLMADGTNVVTQFSDMNSPALSGTPTAPTPTAGDNSTKIATTAFVAGASVTSASKWTTARTLSLGNELSGSVSIDGSGDITLNGAVTAAAKATILADSIALSVALG